MIRFIIFLVMCLPTNDVMAQHRLEILHTNDTHSCILPLNENLADTTVAGRGGFLRRLEMIRREREINPEVLLFDSGDFSQGSPFYTLFKGEVEVELMNRMGYDAVTIGNHEFDFGLENMARMFRQAKFPVVCANYDFKNTPLDGLVKPYVVIERSGVKVGVFGLSPQLEGLVDNKNCEGVKYIDPVEATFEIVKMLRNKEKCDVVVCLSHLGWDESKDSGDKRLISSTKGIDIVLGGHSHTYFKELRYVANAEGKDVPDDQNGKHAVYVGKIILSLSK
ncbi:MAG: bifunctional metallophosphatase/5'-nucleotidase [Prevotella sp.]